MLPKYGVTEVFVYHDYYASLRVKLIKIVDGVLWLLHDAGDALKTVGPIETSQKLYEAPDNFLPLVIDFKLHYIYEEGEYSIPRYKYILHKGSSRSSKSWSIEEWCIRQCETINNKRITVWRDTRASLGDTIWADFKKIFPLSGRNYKFTQDTRPIHFSTTGSIIEPHGADATNAHGMTQDIAWLNEPYKIPEAAFHQIDQRSEQIIIDLNPKANHWSDTISKNPRCKVIHSTFMKNPFCPPEQRRKILSYDPGNPGNVANSTSDAYMWSVYGLGEKAEKPNKIYHGWQKITDDDFYDMPYSNYYGLDFGSSNPTAMVEVKFDGKDSFLFKERIYTPAQDMGCSLSELLTKLGVDKKIPIICDSAEPDSINDLRLNGFNAVPAVKGQGSVNAGIKFLQKYKVYFTKSSVNLENEYDDYEWEIINGVNLDRPLKKDDHLMDAARYCCTFMQYLLHIKK